MSQESGAGVWLKHLEGRESRIPPPCPAGEEAELQIDVRFQAENVLITQLTGDGCQRRSCGALAWPPQSCNSITCDNSLRGMGKEKISQLRLTNVEDLKTATWDCFYVQLSA